MKTKAIRYLNSLINDNSTKAEIDLISFIKCCVREFTEKEENKPLRVNLEPYFTALWSMFPRKVGKEQAKREFEKKFRGLDEQETRDKANKIYIALKVYLSEIEENQTEMRYIKHFSSWLSACVPNSKYYKVR